MRYPPRKRIRLPLDAYSVLGSIWHVTLDTEDRVPVFRDSRIARIADEELHAQPRRRDCSLLLYSVMPDHVHAVIQIGSVDLIRIVRSYKSAVSLQCREARLPAGFWQSRFYDRGIREDQDMTALIGYICANPVDAGLADVWEDYPWIGGTLLKPDG